MKKRSIKKAYWGIVFIAAAVLILLDALNVFTFDSISPWKFGLAAIFLGITVWELVDGHYAFSIIPLSITFLVLEPQIATWAGRTDGNLINNWTVILIAVLLTIGLSFLNFGWGKNKKRLGNTTIYFDAADLSNAEVNDVVGDVQVFISNKDAYTGNGTIKIRDVVGKVVVHVPDEWLVVTNVSDNVGKVTVPEQTRSFYEKNITLDISDIVGNVTVAF